MRATRRFTLFLLIVSMVLSMSVLHVFADGEDGAEIAASLADFAEYVGAQTLALSVAAAPLAEAGDAPEVEWNEGTIRILVTKK